MFNWCTVIDVYSIYVKRDTPVQKGDPHSTRSVRITMQARNERTSSYSAISSVLSSIRVGGLRRAMVIRLLVEVHDCLVGYTEYDLCSTWNLSFASPLDDTVGQSTVASAVVEVPNSDVCHINS
jgi:hypothetical protein